MLEPLSRFNILVVVQVYRSVIPLYLDGPAFPIYERSHLRALLHPDVLFPSSKFSLHFHERVDLFSVHVHEIPSTCASYGALPVVGWLFALLETVRPESQSERPVSIIQNDGAGTFDGSDD